MGLRRIKCPVCKSLIEFVMKLVMKNLQKLIFKRWDKNETEKSIQKQV